MVNLKLMPEHIQLLNALTPHFGKKGQASAGKILSVLPLLAGQSSQGGIDSALNFLAGTGTKVNDDMMLAIGKLVKNMNLRSQKGNPTDSGNSLIVFLILILLLQN